MGGAPGEGEERGVSEQAWALQGSAGLGTLPGLGRGTPLFVEGPPRGSSFPPPEELYPGVSPQRYTDTEGGQPWQENF